LYNAIADENSASTDFCNDSKLHYQSCDDLKEQIAGIESEIEQNSESLQQLLSEESYGPSQVRNRVARLVRFGLQTGQLLSPTSLHGLQGFLSPADIVPWPNLPGELVAVRGLLQGAFCGRCTGSMVMFEHQLLHSSLGSEHSFVLGDLLRRRDLQALTRRLLPLAAALPATAAEVCHLLLLLMMG